MSDMGLVEAFLAGVKHGKVIAQAEVKVNIMKRVVELAQCTKDDNCQEMARALREYLPEFLDNGDDK